MKCIQLDMDGITYFVLIVGGIKKLFVNHLGTEPIYTEPWDIKLSAHKFTKKDAKKFVLRALGVQPIKTG